MKQSVIGSKFINFEYDSNLSHRVFPSNLVNKPHFDKHYGEVEIVVLQVETQVVGNKLYYLVEYIEKE